MGLDAMTVATVVDPRIAHLVAEGMPRLADSLRDLREILGPDVMLDEAAARHLRWLADQDHSTIGCAAALFANVIAGRASATS